MRQQKESSEFCRPVHFSSARIGNFRRHFRYLQTSFEVHSHREYRTFYRYNPSNFQNILKHLRTIEYSGKANS